MSIALTGQVGIGTADIITSVTGTGTRRRDGMTAEAAANGQETNADAKIGTVLPTGRIVAM